MDLQTHTHMLKIGISAPYCVVHMCTYCILGLQCLPVDQISDQIGLLSSPPFDLNDPNGYKDVLQRERNELFLSREDRGKKHLLS